MNPIDYWYQKYLKEKLTWEDVRDILKHFGFLFMSGELKKQNVSAIGLLTDEYVAKEVLKRFNEQREKK